MKKDRPALIPLSELTKPSGPLSPEELPLFFPTGTAPIDHLPPKTQALFRSWREQNTEDDQTPPIAPFYHDPPASADTTRSHFAGRRSPRDDYDWRADLQRQHPNPATTFTPHRNRISMAPLPVPPGRHTRTTDLSWLVSNAPKPTVIKTKRATRKPLLIACIVAGAIAALYAAL